MFRVKTSRLLPWNVCCIRLIRPGLQTASQAVVDVALHAVARTRQLHCFQLRHLISDFIGPQYWPPNSADLNPVDYAVCSLGHFARASLPLPDPWRRPSERLQNGADLTRTSLTELSTSSGSDCVGVSERTEDTLSIKFKRSDYLTWQQLCWLIEFLAGFI